MAATATELNDDVVVVTLTTASGDTEEQISSAMNDAQEAFVVGRAAEETQEKLRGVEGGGAGNPYTVFIDTEGKVREVHRGGAKEAYFTGTAKLILAEESAGQGPQETAVEPTEEEGD